MSNKDDDRSLNGSAHLAWSFIALALKPKTYMTGND
jgi:hypothetical protein